MRYFIKESFRNSGLRSYEFIKTGREKIKGGQKCGSTVRWAGGHLIFIYRAMRKIISRQNNTSTRAEINSINDISASQHLKKSQKVVCRFDTK